ncbi:MAG: imidazole glycerol phosphate synthase subunit HisH [Anaerolineales bacterium]|nr:imidazole glycerol phosphate synthase subunit HisH [Anaerolineales bacterium]
MNSSQVILVDAGTGNLHSVHNALINLGCQPEVTKDPRIVRNGGRIVLPGVGAFGHFMTGLIESGLVEALSKAIRRGDPILGICVGMQAFFEYSEEMGEFAGLGFIPGRVIRFPDMPGLKIPHTGWNQIYRKKESALLNRLSDGVYTYFNHSFYCAAAKEDDILASTSHGITFPSMVQHQNIFGVQFHPEKSQKIGLKILENFIKL